MGQGDTISSCVSSLLASSTDLSHADLHNKRVLYRVDVNVPLTADHQVADATKITSILATLQLLLSKGARIVLCSHLGRPDLATQSLDEMREEFSLAPVAGFLKAQLGADVFTGLATDCVGPAAAQAVDALQPGQACLLENLRFHAGEVDNEPRFAQQLAALADIYVSDAFAVCHRHQASVTGVLQFMPACYPGLLMRAELRYLHNTCDSPNRPFGVVIGGVKVKDKIKVLHSLLHKADVLCIGGRMAFTFLAAAGVAVGRTQIEEEWLEPCNKMRQLAKDRGVQLVLPVDLVVARSLDDDVGCCTVPVVVDCCSHDCPCVPEGCFGLDIGPKTAQLFSDAIQGCKTLFWNGPMGRFEVPGFAAGTYGIARAMGRATQAGASTVVGGGDSVSALKQLQPAPQISYISTGGGAGLELIRGSLLPGIQALAAAAAATAAAQPETPSP